MFNNVESLESHNIKLWDEIDQIDITIYQRATMFLNQSQWARLSETQKYVNHNWSGLMKWRKSPTEKLKCNIDAFFMCDNV